MLIVKLDLMHGQVLPDLQVEPFVDSYIQRYHMWKASGSDVEVIIGSEIMFDAFRLAVVEGKVSPDEITFVANDKSYGINEYGVLPNMAYPQELTHMNIVQRILEGAIKKHKHKKITL